MSILLEISEALQKGNAKVVSGKTVQALGDGVEPYDILTQGLIAGMNVIGVKFRNDEIYVPEVMMSAKAMYAGLDILKPKLAETGVKPVGKVCLVQLRVTCMI